MFHTPAFWYRKGSGKALAPFGALYGIAGSLRRWWTVPQSAGVPVICIGNLVAGGAGKTPVALDLLRRLSAQGWTPHALTRGYGGRITGPVRVDAGQHTAADVGDEALLLAQAAPVWAGRDRVASAHAAVAAGANILVMDDGFQNPRLKKDISLLVVDGGAGFGNGYLIPAGPLRESVHQGLARTDAVVMIGHDEWGVAQAVNGICPIFHTRLAPSPDSAARLSGQRIIAFAGIGRPEKFFATCREIGAELVETVKFPDHHAYTDMEFHRLNVLAEQHNALLVTTTKDAVRLPHGMRERVAILEVGVAWDDPSQIDMLLRERLSR